MGQLKLLISEILFLTKKSKPGNKVLYVGAAEGYHIAMLADMFPTLTFDLWDPSPFHVDKRPTIKIFNKFFTDGDAQSYKSQGNNILFISDIRNLDIGSAKRHYTQEKYNAIINEDQIRQFKWVQDINPICAFLKFKTLYGPGKTEYFNGKVYLQAYSPLSIETRLMTCDYKDIIKYDNTEFDSKLAYFNCFIRGETAGLTRWKKIMDKYKIRNMWDNNYAFYVISLYLDKMKGIKDDDEKTAQTFNNIIEFLRKKYHDKYNYIYTQ